MWGTALTSREAAGMLESSFHPIKQSRRKRNHEKLDINRDQTSPERVMALLSSSYQFTASMPYMGFIPSQQMPPTSANFPLVGLRIPPYFPSAFMSAAANGPSAIHAGFSATHNSAFARLAAAEGHITHRKHNSAISPVHLTHRSTSSKVVDFSIDGILGTRNRENEREDVDDDDDEEEEDDEHVIISERKDEERNIIHHRQLISGPVPETENKSTLIEKPNKSSIDQDNPLARFSWLQCTRYKPPRLPRTKRKDASKKRKLGRNPRVPFSPAQVATLEQKFRCTHYLSSYDVAELSTALNLSENRVKIWFQNRRARERRDKDAVEKNFNPTIVPASPPVSSSLSSSSPIINAIPSPPVTSPSVELHHTSQGILVDHLSRGSPNKSLISFSTDKFSSDINVVSSSYSPLDFSSK